MTAQEASLLDRSGRRYPADQPRWRGDDGSPLVFEPLPGIGRAQIDTAVNSQWRYRAALPNPLAHIKPVTLGEGRTPLITRTFNGIDVGLKVGQQSETISVEAQASPINFDNGTLQGGADPETVKNLPLVVEGKPRSSAALAVRSVFVPAM